MTLQSANMLNPTFVLASPWTQMAKMMKYLGEARSPATSDNIWQFLADRFFEAFAVVFFITRLVMYEH